MYDSKQIFEYTKLDLSIKNYNNFEINLKLEKI